MPRVSNLLRETPLRLRLRFVAKLPAAARYLEREFQKDLSRPGTEANRSSPGEAPRKQSGVGRTSVRCRMTLLPPGLAVEANAYMRHLNEGTKRIAPRPWVAITMRRAGPNARRMVFGKGEGG